MLGTMVADPGTTAWIIGFVMHLMISGLIALIYAWGFEHVTHRAGWAVGAGFSLIHSVIAGMAMGMIPLIHPRMPNPVMPPGFFMANLGTIGPVIVFMFHAVYGAIVGAIYGPAGQRAGDHQPAAH